MGISVKIKVGNMITGPISVNSGQRQDDSMSSLLFNLVLEKFTKKLNIRFNQRLKL